MNIKNKTAQSLILANVLIMGLASMAYAHEEIPAQEASMQRPVSPGKAKDNQDDSTRTEDTARGKSSSESSSTSRDSVMTDRSSQGIGIDRDDRSVGRQSQDWGANRSDDHGRGH
jgi:hypothetical protein